MNVTFTIDITSLKTTGSLDNYSDVVTLVDYDMTGSFNGLSSSISETIFLPPPIGSFTDFDNLTEGEVKAWVTGSPAFIKQQGPVVDDIYKQRQTVQGSLPWNS